MQVSKLFPVVGLTVLCLGLVSVRAQDTPAQAAARAALLEKMDEMNGGAPTNAEAPAPPATVAPAPAESPEATSPPPAAVSMSPAESPEQAAARAALIEKMSEMNSAESSNAESSAPSVVVNMNESQNVSTPAPVAGAAAPPAAATPPPAEATSAPRFLPVPPPSGTYIYNGSTQATLSASAPNNVSTPAPSVMGASSTASSVTAPSSEMMTNETTTMPATPPAAEVTGAPISMPPPSSSTGYDEAAQAALHQSQTNIAVTGAPVNSGPAPAPSVPNVSVSQPEQSNVDEITARELGLPAIQPPPPPVSAEQQEQLQELLQRYDANQITPEEYQIERAKIMGGQ